MAKIKISKNQDNKTLNDVQECRKYLLTSLSNISRKYEIGIIITALADLLSIIVAEYCSPEHDEEVIRLLKHGMTFWREKFNASENSCEES